jgi:hypothetical protein
MPAFHNESRPYHCLQANSQIIYAERAAGAGTQHPVTECRAISLYLCGTVREENGSRDAVIFNEVAHMLPTHWS